MRDQRDLKLPTDSCNSLLLKSIQLYKALDDRYKTLPKILKQCSKHEAQKNLTELNNLLKNARSIDKLIKIKLAAEETPDSETAELLNRRQLVLARLLKSNGQVIGRVENVKSVVRNELSHLSASRNAVREYGQDTQTNRNMINSSC